MNVLRNLKVSYDFKFTWNSKYRIITDSKISNAAPNCNSLQLNPFSALQWLMSKRMQILLITKPLRSTILCHIQITNICIIVLDNNQYFARYLYTVRYVIIVYQAHTTVTPTRDTWDRHTPKTWLSWLLKICFIYDVKLHQY